MNDKEIKMAVAGRFPCPKCKRVFRAPTGRGSHMKAAHGVDGTSVSTLAAKAKKSTLAAKKWIKIKERKRHKTTEEKVREKKALRSKLTRDEKIIDHLLTQALEPEEDNEGEHFIGTEERMAKKQIAVRQIQNSLATIDKEVMSKGLQDLLVDQGEEETHADQEAAAILASQDLKIALAVAFGAVREHCLQIAEEHGQPGRQFTARVAELLLRDSHR